MSVQKLKSMLPKNATFWFYDKLPKTLNALFRGKESAVVFYQIHDNRGKALEGTGHFSLVIRGTKPHFFSSYGFSPEQEIHKTHSSGKLLKLLGKGFTRNRRAYQTGRDTQTCGYHCIVRAHFPRLNATQYSKIISKFSAPRADDLVAALCLLKLQEN